MSSTKPQQLQRVAKAVAIGLVLLAVVTELRKPRDARTWHGQVVGFVPYELRMPTVARLRERLWAPEDPRVVMPQVFGVGWTVNFGRVAALLRRRTAG
jgi:Family of unknown function (DUF5808)